jgi:hypothetical protein
MDTMDYAKAVEYGRVLERLAVQEGNIVEIRDRMNVMKVQLDELIALANRGKGAWWVSLTFVSGVSSVLAWAVTHFWRS